MTKANLNPLIFRPSRHTVVYAAPCGADRVSGHETAWALLDELLRKERGRSLDSYTLCRSELGKPYFSEEDTPFFSLSHTAGYAAAVISAHPVGIDLEKIRPISDRIADRYLYLHPMLFTPLPGMTGRVIAWTRLESYGKITGRGFLEKEFSLPCQFTTHYDIPGHILTVCEAHKERSAL